jgi:signal transduction histidine kinase
MTPFGQVDSTLARRYEGTGLGLPIAKKFIESMGGDFGIESEVDVGTTITISLPKAPRDWTGEPVTMHATEETSHVASSDEPA